ncbi:SPW repeat protein [Patescibacteria group bacterium]|nr:SPW repeat protein [Patescibacteria group bacterium]
MKWTQWILLILGLWLLLSPWLLGFSAFNLVAWNNILVGALIIIFVFWHFADTKNS